MKVLLLLLCLNYSFSTLAAVSIVSDLDDTIKISSSDGDITDYFGDDVFTGIPEFFRGTRAYSNELYILSASPGIMRAKIAFIMAQKQIQYKQMILRENLFEEKLSYKIRNLKRILNSTSDDFIFIGDDLGDDPEAYAHIKKLYPSRVLDIYIHVVNGRNLDVDVIPYWTTFDLFLREFSAGRMSSDWVEFAWEKLMKEINFKLILPKAAHCPSNSSVWEWQLNTVFQPEAHALMDRLITFCLQR